MSVDYMRPNFFENPIQRLKQSRVETRSLAEMPQPNIGPLQPVLNGSVHGRIKAYCGNIVRFRQADHQVAGHLLGAANAERRGDVQDSKPFESGHVYVCGVSAAAVIAPGSSLTDHAAVMYKEERQRVQQSRQRP